ncbi:MAG TPA: 5'-methylthioadenosine/adenosylhomocysteine nucleosidase [Dongiaceae bacterium]|jgi:adenosylhomocysteine nucleosidase|nr:5'-methylthioadenosine/adenosylhomocysteine nucleosidase [Dongiaceae bacterium]
MLNERIPLGIICAMAEEIAALLGDMTEVERHELAGREVLQGKLYGRPVAMIESGIGKVASAMTATLLLDGLRCRAIVMSGVAGGVDPELAIGDLVVARRLIQHDYGRVQAGELTPFRPGVPPFGPGRNDYGFDLPEDLVARIHRALDGFALPALPADLFDDDTPRRAPVIKVGTIVSGDQFINDEQVRRRLHHEFNAHAVEMEGAAVAQVAKSFGVPAVVIRSLSDLAGAESHLDFGRFVTAVAPVAARVVERLVAVLD